MVPASGDPHLSTDTIIEYQKVYRDMIGDHMVFCTSGYMVGGPGTTIEIDESMFGELFFIFLIQALKALMCASIPC